MYDVFKNKRREPRVKLHTRVTVSGSDANGARFTCDTVTVDVSPHGAAVAVEGSMRRGAVVDFRTRDYEFHTRAVIRTVDVDRESGRSIIGIEYLDEVTNPVIIWMHPSTQGVES